MNWEIRIAERVRKQLGKIQEKDRGYILLALREMQGDPFGGDVVWLKNQPYTLRRRAGVWRILFDIDKKSGFVIVGDIKRRTGNTYK
jgi:mRNA-degrading endonuclease RelE of RelBE toxin-antitoxin system